jgi:hypothetical protein
MDVFSDEQVQDSGISVLRWMGLKNIEIGENKVPYIREEIP